MPDFSYLHDHFNHIIDNAVEELQPSAAPNCIKDFLDLLGDSGQSGLTLQFSPEVILANQVWRHNCFQWKQLQRQTWLARITWSANENALYNLGAELC